MKTILPFFFLVFALSIVQGQQFAGQYTGTYNGDAIHLSLEAAGSGKWKGSMNDSQQQYTVTATSQGNKITGSATCEALAVTFELAGQLSGNTLDVKMNFLGVEMPVLFTKSGKTAAPAASASSGKNAETAMPSLPSNAKHDPALVGVWVRQENYNSGSGMDGYYSNNSYLSFNANGTLSDLGGETMMGSNSGSGRASNAGNGTVPGVKWYSDKNSLFLVATDGQKTETARLGRYFIENGALLITADNGTKVLYYRK